MTDKELKKLTRMDLLELLHEQSKEIDRLQAEVSDLKAKLESKDIIISNAGSIAEAALKLNGIFEDAQAAAEQYLLNIKRKDGA